MHADEKRHAWVEGWVERLVAEDYEDTPNMRLWLEAYYDKRPEEWKQRERERERDDRETEEAFEGMLDDLKRWFDQQRGH